jgi:hypothetical protein
MVHIADDRLSALVHRDVLDSDGLIASAPVSLERLHLRRKGPGELIERTLSAILLWDSLRAPETKRKCHDRCVNGNSRAIAVWENPTLVGGKIHFDIQSYLPNPGRDGM